MTPNPAPEATNVLDQAVSAFLLTLMESYTADQINAAFEKIGYYRAARALTQGEPAEAVRVLWEEIGTYSVTCAKTGELAPNMSLVEAIDRLAALAGAQAPGAMRESDQQLMRFYSVETIPALIDAQERHIAKLQAKLPPLRDEFPKNPRGA